MNAVKRVAYILGLCWLCASLPAYGDDSAVPMGAFNPPKETDQNSDADADSVNQQPPKEEISAKPPEYLKQIPQVTLEVKTAIDQCKNKYILGEIKTHARLVHCINPRIMAAYQQAGYPYMDLIEQLNAKRLSIAMQIDKKNISEKQGEVTLSEFSAHITDEEHKRNLAPNAQKP